MRRLLIPGVLSTLLALNAGAALAASNSLAGTWAAAFASHPIKLQLTGSGSSYKGTYSFNLATVVKGKVKNTTESVPVKVSEATKNKQVHVTITFTKSKATILCGLSKNTLICRPLVGTTPIVFTHSGH
ncbi:MAG TPA: hypothetical protein VNL35_15240 [Chloroflexota bacterium]|nr:hypothetical protein [Chloroflexota bacterium]